MSTQKPRTCARFGCFEPSISAKGFEPLCADHQPVVPALAVRAHKPAPVPELVPAETEPEERNTPIPRPIIALPNGACMVEGCAGEVAANMRAPRLCPTHRKQVAKSAAIPAIIAARNGASAPITAYTLEKMRAVWALVEEARQARRAHAEEIRGLRAQIDRMRAESGDEAHRRAKAMAADQLAQAERTIEELRAQLRTAISIEEAEARIGAATVQARQDAECERALRYDAERERDATVERVHALAGELVRSTEALLAASAALGYSNDEYQHARSEIAKLSKEAT